MALLASLASARFARSRLPHSTSVLAEIFADRRRDRAQRSRRSSTRHRDPAGPSTGVRPSPAPAGTARSLVDGAHHRSRVRMPPPDRRDRDAPRRPRPTLRGTARTAARVALGAAASSATVSTAAAIVKGPGASSKPGRSGRQHGEYVGEQRREPSPGTAALAGRVQQDQRRLRLRHIGHAARLMPSDRRRRSAPAAEVPGRFSVLHRGQHDAG